MYKKKGRKEESKDKEIGKKRNKKKMEGCGKGRREGGLGMLPRDWEEE